MMLYRYLLVFFVLLFSIDTQAQIFICVDQNGQRHYSDKRCPSKKLRQTSSIDSRGQEKAPNNVQLFTSAIELLKRSYALMTIYEPENQEYSELYNLITRAELKHMRFMSNPIPARYQNYSPFLAKNQARIIANISNACRQRGYFSVCAAVEGNPWIAKHEKTYLSSANVESSAGEFCEKAIDALAGGVISRKMMDFFCRSVAIK